MVQKSGQPPWDVKTTSIGFSPYQLVQDFFTATGSMHPSVAPHFLLVTIGLGLKVFMLHNSGTPKGKPVDYTSKVQDFG